MIEKSTTPPDATTYPHKIELCCTNVQLERHFLRGATQKYKRPNASTFRQEKRITADDAPLPPRFSPLGFQFVSSSQHSGSLAGCG
ncbi:hypothetical protein C5P22_14205 [Escherichia coli]|nr:hypothetical protein C5P22_14205 [Escherichia coli]